MLSAAVSELSVVLMDVLIARCPATTVYTHMVMVSAVHASLVTMVIQ